MKRIYFDLFSTARFNGEPIEADKEKMLCPLAAVVQQQGYRGKFILLGNASIGKSSNIESLKLHLIVHHRVFCYFNLNKFNIESLKKPINLPKDCIVILDSLDEVQKRRNANDYGDSCVDTRKEAEAFVNSFVNDPKVSCVIIASRFNPGTTKVEGYSQNFLKDFDEIRLSELTETQIDILIEKFGLNVDRDSFAYTLFKTPMYLSMTVEMGEVDKAIEDEASFIDAYLNKLHQTKQSQNDKNDSFIDGSLFEMAYEMVRGRTYSKNISIPQAFNTIFDLINVNNSIFALNYSSVRYISFAAAKHILIKLDQLCRDDDIDEKHLKILLDFPTRPNEVLRFVGELLRHHENRSQIISALNAKDIKQETQWYYNIVWIVLISADDISSIVHSDYFEAGPCFLKMCISRNEYEIASMYGCTSDYLRKKVKSAEKEYKNKESLLFYFLRLVFALCREGISFD